MSDEATTTTDEGTTDTTVESTWFDGLPDDARTAHEALKGKSLPDVLTDYRTLEDRLGRAIEVPGEDATQEDKDAFAAKLKAVIGVPESAGDYVKALPKEIPADDPMVAAFLASAHDAGLTVDQVNGVIKTVATQLNAQGEEAKQQAVEALKKEWGKDFVQNLESAHRGLKAAATEAGLTADQVEQVIDGKGWGNDPVLVKMFAQIGRFYAEDYVPVGMGAPGKRQQYTDAGHPILEYEPGFGKK